MVRGFTRFLNRFVNRFSISSVVIVIVIVVIVTENHFHFASLLWRVCMNGGSGGACGPIEGAVAAVVPVFAFPPTHRVAAVASVASLSAATVTQIT